MFWRGALHFTVTELCCKLLFSDPSSQKAVQPLYTEVYTILQWGLQHVCDPPPPPHPHDLSSNPHCYPIHISHHHPPSLRTKVRIPQLTHLFIYLHVSIIFPKSTSKHCNVYHSYQSSATCNYKCITSCCRVGVRSNNRRVSEFTPQIYSTVVSTCIKKCASIGKQNYLSAVLLMQVGNSVLNCVVKHLEVFVSCTIW